MGVFPEELAGRSVDCVFPGFVPRLTFGADGLRVEAQLADLKIDDVVPAQVAAIRPNVFTVHWTESNGNFVVQVQDYETSRVHNYARLADGSAFCSTGELRPVAA